MREFEITVRAADDKRGMTSGEVISALADVADGTVPTVTIGWRGQVKAIRIKGTEPDNAPLTA